MLNCRLNIPNKVYLAFLLLFVFSSVKAQLSKKWDFTTTFQVGYFTNYSDQREELGDTAGINYFTEPAYNYGLVVNKFLNRNYQIGLGANYENRKFTANYYCTTCDSLTVKTDEIYDVNYLNIPLHLDFMLIEETSSLYCRLGVSTNFLLDGSRQQYNINNTLETAELPEQLKNIQFDLIIGFEYKLQMNELVEWVLGVEYKQAMGSIMDDFTFKNKRYGLYSGLAFAF